MKKAHHVDSIRFEKNEMILDVDGKIIRVNLVKVSSKLAKANADARNNFIVSPSGYGIHWPQLDEDLSIDGLLKPVKTARRKTRSANG